MNQRKGTLAATVLAAMTMTMTMRCVEASVYNDNMYFPEITKKEIVDSWKKIDAHSFIKPSFSCEHIHM